jgi:hypothetical protein
MIALIGHRSDQRRRPPQLHPQATIQERDSEVAGEANEAKMSAKPAGASSNLRGHEVCMNPLAVAASQKEKSSQSRASASYWETS